MSYFPMGRLNVKTTLYTLFIVLTATRSTQAESKSLRFVTQSSLKDDAGYHLVANNDTITLTVLKFYVSGLRITFNSGPCLADSGHHLIDLSDSAIAAIGLPLNSGANITGIEFDLGIDSATNVAGVLGGDLDPTNGMYWTWQSGYINFKVEGTGKKNKRYEYHLGGYRYPYPTLQHITLNNVNGSDCILFSLSDFFAAIPPEEKPEIMSPGAAALRLSKIAASAFKLCDQ